MINCLKLNLPTINNHNVNIREQKDTNKAIFITKNKGVEDMIRCYIETSDENVKEAEDFLRIEINDWPE